MEVLYRGESKLPEVQVTYDNGTAVNHADIVALEVYATVRDTVVAKFMKGTPTAGFMQLIQRPSAGLYAVPIEADTTKDWPIGILKLEVRMQMTNADLPADGWVSIGVFEAYKILDNNIE